VRRAAHIFAAAGCTDMTQLNEIPEGDGLEHGVGPISIKITPN
jgi:hypothetical protein